MASDALVHEHGDGGEQASVPGEAGLEPVEEVEEDFGGVVEAGGDDVAPGGCMSGMFWSSCQSLAPTMPARTTMVTMLRASASEPLRTRFL